MPHHITILIFLFLYSLRTASQETKLPINVFYGHLQTCHYTGTTEEDFVIEVFADFTIKLARYKSSHIDRYNSVQREIFIGTYKITSDTIEVTYGSQRIDFKNRPQKNQTTVADRAKLVVRWPSSVFVLQSNSIVTIDNLFPRLSKSHLSVSSQLELEFNNWDKIKFGKKIFGVPGS